MKIEIRSYRGRALRLLAAAVFSLGLTACGPDFHFGGYQAEWSPDGRMLAIVANLIDEDEFESGVWVHDLPAGMLRQVTKIRDGEFAVQPRWSQDGRQLLFAAFPREPEDGSDVIQVSTWVVNADGTGLRKVIETPMTGDNAERMIYPGMIAWGPGGESIWVPVEHRGRLAAVMLDPLSGRFLGESPVAGDLVSMVSSPASGRVAGFSYRDDTAEVSLSEKGGFGWRPVASYRLEGNTLESCLPAITWSPDGRFFVLPQTVEISGDAVENRLRLFDATTGTSRIVASGDANAEIRWTPDCRSFYFSRPRSDDHAGGIYRVDLDGDRAVPIVTDDGLHLLGLAAESGRLYFSETLGAPGSAERAVWSSDTDGTGVRLEAVVGRDESFGWLPAPGGRWALFCPLSGAPTLVRLGERREFIEFALTRRQMDVLVDSRYSLLSWTVRNPWSFSGARRAGMK